MAVAQRRRGHARSHSLHGRQCGLGLQKHPLDAQALIPRGAHRVRHVQTQAAVQRPAVGVAQLCGVIDHRARKACILQGVQPGGGFLFQLAEHDAGQFQQRFLPPCLGDALGLGNRENQVFQLFHSIRRALGRIGKPRGQCRDLPDRVRRVGGQRDILRGVGPDFAAFFQQLIQCFAAQLVPGRTGQEA